MYKGIVFVYICILKYINEYIYKIIEMKVALCFLISYQHILNQETIWKEWIEENKHFINIYFHYTNYLSIKSSWIRKYIIPKKYIVPTSYYYVSHAYLSILRYAIENDVENEWFIFLTDSCAPICSPTRFRETFFEKYQTSCIGWKPIYWNPYYMNRANLKYISKEYWLSNEPWFILCKLDANYILKEWIKSCFIYNKFGKKDVIQIVSQGIISNESLFAILLKKCNRLTTNINSISHLYDFKYKPSSPTSPHYFEEDTNEEINHIQNMIIKEPQSLFIRKIGPKFKIKSLKELWIFSDNILLSKSPTITTS